MEKIVQKLLVLTGVFIGASLALSPLTTYADSTVAACPSASTEPTEGALTADEATGNTEVCVRVDSVLSLDAANSDKIVMYPDTVRTGHLDVKVRSAKPYTISLSSEEPNLVEVESQSFFIVASSKVGNGKVGWGIRKYGQTEGYTAIASVPQVFFDSTVNDNGTGTDVADASTDHSFEIGVSVTDKVVQGTYATNVTVTAAVKQ